MRPLTLRSIKWIRARISERDDVMIETLQNEVDANYKASRDLLPELIPNLLSNDSQDKWLYLLVLPMLYVAAC